MVVGARTPHPEYFTSFDRAQRRMLKVLGAQRFRDSGSLPLEHRLRRLRRHVTRREAGPAGGQHNACAPCDFEQRGGDLVAVVRNNPVLNLEALAGQELDEQAAALVVAATLSDAVRHGHDCSLQAGSFDFSKSTTSEIIISLSIAFAMS